jgi:hypothetical protein
MARFPLTQLLAIAALRATSFVAAGSYNGLANTPPMGWVTPSPAFQNPAHITSSSPPLPG